MGVGGGVSHVGWIHAGPHGSSHGYHGSSEESGVGSGTGHGQSGQRTPNCTADHALQLLVAY